MELVRKSRKFVKRILLGSADIPQQCVVGLPDPQPEVTVRLQGFGAPRNVTASHMMACGAPFMVGIGFEGEQPSLSSLRRPISLTFHESAGDQPHLGKISLQYDSLIPVDGMHLCLFRIRSSRNYCLPLLRLWGFHYQYARMRQGIHHSDVPITAREVHAMSVFYICPRPTVLVSAQAGDSMNMFPMNLMGTVGSNHFAFALNSSRAAAPLVTRAGQVAISDVPIGRAPTVQRLGSNHRKTSIDWDQLGFPTKPSLGIGVRVPEFAMRVRELKIEMVRQVGSHTLFIASTFRDTHVAEGSRFFVVHGIYQAWRQNLGRPDITAFPSMAANPLQLKSKAAH